MTYLTVAGPLKKLSAPIYRRRKTCSGHYRRGLKRRSRHCLKHSRRYLHDAGWKSAEQTQIQRLGHGTAGSGREARRPLPNL